MCHQLCSFSKLFCIVPGGQEIVVSCRGLRCCPAFLRSDIVFSETKKSILLGRKRVNGWSPVPNLFTNFSPRMFLGSTK